MALRHARFAITSQSFRNVVYVGAVQLATLTVPLITTPWILRALEPAAYGKYALALAVVQYGIIIVDFGFYLTATRRIAQMRDNRDDVTRYFWTVQTARLLLAVLGAFAVIAAVCLIPKFWPLVGVTLSALPALLGTLLNPQWLFLGLEHIKTVSLANIAARSVSVIPILVFVKDPGDLNTAAFLSSCNYLFAGIISALVVAKRGFVGRPCIPRRAELVSAYRDAWPLFVTSMAFSLYSASNTVVLGLVRSTSEVAVFSAADRLRQAAVMPISPISTVFFPKLARMLEVDRRRALKLILVLTMVLLLGTTFISLTTLMLAPWIIELYTGGAYSEAVPVLRILSIAPIFIGLNTALGTLVMINVGMSKQCSRIVVAGGLLNLILLFWLGALNGAQGAATAVVTTEAFVTLAMSIALKRAGFYREVIGAVFGDSRTNNDEDN